MIGFKSFQTVPHSTHTLFNEARRWLNVVEALDLEAARGVQQGGQQLLGHVHLRRSNVSKIETLIRDASLVESTLEIVVKAGL